MSARIPTGQERTALDAARYLLVERSPYYAVLIFQMPTLITDEGSWVDQRGRVYIDEHELEQSPTVLSYVLEHAMLHVAYRHRSRMAGFPDRRRAHLAACLELNSRLPLSPCPHDLGLPDGLTAEQLYDLLDVTIDSGCDLAATSDDNGGPDSAMIDLAARAMAEEAIRHAASRPGDVPDDVLRWANGLLDTPKLPWRTLLATAAQSILARVAGRSDYSMARPSRRPNGEFVRPSMVGYQPNVTVIVDTSGSMTDDDLAAALGEVSGVLAALNSTVTFIACDADTADGAQTVRSLSEIRLRGGGGTDMTAGIAAALAAGTPDMIVVITDGHTPWPPASVGTPVIVAITGDGPNGPDWAVTVRIDEP